jgi:hypothetical protein
MLARRDDETTYIAIPSTVRIYDSFSQLVLLDKQYIYRASISCTMYSMIVTLQSALQQASSH